MIYVRHDSAIVVHSGTIINMSSCTTSAETTERLCRYLCVQNTEFIVETYFRFIYLNSVHCLGLFIPFTSLFSCSIFSSLILLHFIRPLLSLLSPA